MVRGKRVHNLNEEEGFSMFSRRTDSDYEGLRLPEVIPEDILNQPQTTREIRQEDVFQHTEVEVELFNRDLGESSNSD